MDMIAAVDKNWAIGNNGALLKSLKKDMAFFRQITKGKTVILGRKTLESFPGGKPLKGRSHILFSRTVTEELSNVYRVENLEALKTLKMDLSESFVIGGESIYRLLMPYCDKAYITKMNQAYDADTYFPNLDSDPDWIQVKVMDQFSESGVEAEIIVYQNQKIKRL